MLFRHSLPPLEKGSPLLPRTTLGGNLVLRDRDLITVINIFGNRLGSVRVVVTLEPLVESTLILVAVRLDGLRKNLCAFGKAVDVVDTQETETDVGAGVVLRWG